MDTSPAGRRIEDNISEFSLGGCRQPRRPVTFNQAHHDKNGYDIGKEKQQQFSAVAGHAAFSCRAPLNLFLTFLTAINLPSVLYRLVQAVFPVSLPLS